MTKPALRIVAPEPVVCWAWHLRDLLGLPESPRGGQCDTCRRDVAVPRWAGTRRPVCIYCAMDEGLIQPIDEPIT
mgnify:CR=1 FL=1